MVVPNPLRHGLRALDTACLMCAHCLLLLLRVHLGQGLCEARADNEDVSLLECSTLLFGHGLKIGDLDCVVREGVVLDALTVGVGLVVEEDATGYQTATLVPVLESSLAAVRLDQARKLTIQRREQVLASISTEVLCQLFYRWLRAIVAFPRGLMEEVASNFVSVSYSC